MLALTQLDAIEKLLSEIPDDQPKAEIVKNGTGWSVEWADHSVLLEMGNDENEVPLAFAMLIANPGLFKQLFGSYVETMQQLANLRKAFNVTFNQLQEENETYKAELLSILEANNVQGEDHNDQ